MNRLVVVLGIFSMLGPGIKAVEPEVLGCFSSTQELVIVHDEILEVSETAGTITRIRNRRRETVPYWTRRCQTDTSPACKQEESKCKLEYIIGKKPKAASP